MTVRAVRQRIGDRVLASFGRTPADRARIVRAMLEPSNSDAIGYWLQLVIATMLATLGLALNSTAVVIGAMLIAPLMRPLVEIAMGLATGSAALTLRALARTAVSIGVVVAVAVGIVWLLPFQTVTAELEARTAPTLLDLVVAAACALAAAYATLRSDTDIATTAAGTSIGISLVPPLCASGYGIALGDLTISRGAALLFTANLSGILAIAAAVFVLAGFGRVDVLHEESEIDDARPRRLAFRAGRAWSKLATARLGVVARFVPPLLLVAIVFVPLQRALGEIRHRNAIAQAVSSALAPTERRVVQYTLDQTATAVVLRVVIVGDARSATDLDRELRERLGALAVERPRLSVWAVPDAAAISSLAQRIDDLPPPVAPEPLPASVHRYSSDVAQRVRAVWPTDGTGPLVRVWLDLDRPDRLRVAHLGSPLGATGLQLLARALEPTAGALTIDEEALTPVEADAANGRSWLPEARALVTRARAVDVPICLTLARATGKARPTGKPTDADGVREAMQAFLLDVPGVTVRDGERWSAVPSRGDCAPATSPASQ